MAPSARPEGAEVREVAEVAEVTEGGEAGEVMAAGAEPGRPGSFGGFVEVADAIRDAPGKLAKTRLLAEFLRDLPPEDLAQAAIYFTGAAFPPASGRTLQAGYAQLISAALSVTGAGGEEFGREFLRFSDLGEAIGSLYAADRPPSGLSLAALARELEGIAEAPAGTAKTPLVTALFARLDAREALYLAKIVTGDLRIGLKEGLVEEAVAAAFAAPAKEVRRAHQLTGDLGRTAVAAREGALAGLDVRLFTPLKPMLATAESDPAAIAQRLGGELWIEDKFDGIRAQAHVAPGRVALYSRDLKEVTGQFPEVAAALEALPGTLILDGELLAYRDGAALPFLDLQKRLGRKAPGAAALAAVPVVYFAFDLLYQDGALLDQPLRERRSRLEALPRPGALQLSPLRVRPPEELEREFGAARERANEGLMIKAPESPYVPGRRGMSWLKYKRPLEPLDVVVTGVEYGHGRRRAVLSDYTFAVRDAESGELVNVGKAYTGLTDAEIEQLTEYFRRNTLRSYGRFQLVRPELVIEVAFEAIQKSARHRSGYALRFPRIVRLRPDKSPAEINTLADVARLYESYRAVYERGAGEE